MKSHIQFYWSLLALSIYLHTWTESRKCWSTLKNIQNCTGSWLGWWNCSHLQTKWKKDKNISNKGTGRNSKIWISNCSLKQRKSMEIGIIVSIYIFSSNLCWRILLGKMTPKSWTKLLNTSTLRDPSSQMISSSINWG